MKVGLLAYVAYPAIGLAAVQTVAEVTNCGDWRMLAVFLLGMVLPTPRRLSELEKALRNKGGSDGGA